MIQAPEVESYGSNIFIIQTTGGQQDIFFKYRDMKGKPRSLYHKTLRIHNLWRMDIFCSKLVSFPLIVTLIGLDKRTSFYTTETIKYKKIMIQAPGACIIKLITDEIYGFHNKQECLSLASVSSLVQCLGTNTLAYYGNCKLRP